MDNAEFWEYRVESVGGLIGPKDARLEEMLNEWGAEGWEAFAATIRQSDNRLTIFARRRLSGAPPRRRSPLPGTF